MDKVYIREEALIAKIAAMALKSKKAAIVFGSNIYLYGISRYDFLQNKKWVLHELKHVSQYNREGFLKFIFMYFLNYTKYGYVNNPYEIEARAAENDMQLLTKYQIV